MSLQTIVWFAANNTSHMHDDINQKESTEGLAEFSTSYLVNLIDDFALCSKSPSTKSGNILFTFVARYYTRVHAVAHLSAIFGTC